MRQAIKADAGRSMSLSYCVPFPPRLHVEAPGFGQGDPALAFTPCSSRSCDCLGQVRQGLGADRSQALALFAAEVESLPQVAALQRGFWIFQEHLTKLAIHHGCGKQVAETVTLSGWLDLPAWQKELALLGG